MSLQTRLAVRCEERNETAKEDVARGYNDVRSSFFLSFLWWVEWLNFWRVCAGYHYSNIPGIRCMAFERIFNVQFNSSVNKTLSTGIKGAFAEVVLMEWQVGLLYTWLKRSCSDSGAYWLRSICCCIGMVGHCLTPEVLALWCSGNESLERLLDGLMLNQKVWIFFDSSLLFSLIYLFLSRFPGLVLVR